MFDLEKMSFIFVLEAVWSDVALYQAPHQTDLNIPSQLSIVVRAAREFSEHREAALV